MSKYVWAIMMILCLLTGRAQNTPCMRNVHAYSQEVLGGAAPALIIDQHGNEREQTPERVFRYFIFVEVAPTCFVTIKNVWINRKLYEITVDLIKATPVFLTDYTHVTNPEQRIVVPKTGNKVFRIKIGSISRAHIATPSSTAKIKSPGEVIVGYVYKGKQYYLTTSRIKKLDPLAAQ